MRLTFRLTILTLFVSATLIGNADTIIYTNFGTSQSYNTSAGYGIGFFDNANQVVAMPFVPTESAILTDAILPLDEAIGTSQLNVYIESSFGGAPGTILDTLSQVGSLPIGRSGLVTFACSSCSVLTAGTSYFVVAQQSDPADHTSWLTTLGVTGSFFTNQNGSTASPWDENLPGVLSAFQVDGTALAPVVPEPSTITLLGLGTAAIATLNALRRRVANT